MGPCERRDGFTAGNCMLLFSFIYCLPFNSSPVLSTNLEGLVLPFFISLLLTFASQEQKVTLCHPICTLPINMLGKPQAKTLMRRRAAHCAIVVEMSDSFIWEWHTSLPQSPGSYLSSFQLGLVLQALDLKEGLHNVRQSQKGSAGPFLIKVFYCTSPPMSCLS